VEELRKRGFSVWITSALGNGGPDFVVGGWKGKGTGRMNLLVELKDPAQPYSKQKQTDAEFEFAVHWRGPYLMATTVEQILAAFEAV
jgi:hypothetical protein